VVNAIWEIPLIAGAGWTASRMLRRWGPQAQHAAWVATFLLGIVTPALPFWGALFSARFAGGDAANVSVAVGAVSRACAVQGGAMLLPAWLIWALCGGYVCALLYFAVRLLGLLAATAALVRESKPVLLSGQAATALEDGQRAFAARDAAVLCSEKVRGVVTVGSRKPVIVVPAGFMENCTKSDFLSAIGHELAHIRRRDYAKNLFYEAASLAVAFHPVAWVMKAQMVATREMICDAMVVEKLVEPRSYRRSLLRLAQRMVAGRAAGVHALGIFDANVLEERIVMMKTKRAVLSRPARGGLIMCAALLLGLAVASSAFAKGVAADHDGPYGTVYHPGDDVSNPVLVVAPDAVYPKSARLSPGQPGAVCVVGAIVDREGLPQDVHVVRSAGKDFDASAMKAVRQYRFKPGVRFGSPVAVAINIEVNFRKY
jgi:TonB family protein